MRYIYFFLLLCICTKSFSQTNVLQAQYFGGSSNDSFDEMVLLSNGDYIVSAGVGGLPDTPISLGEDHTYGGAIEAALIYYNSDGTIGWWTFVGASQGDYIRSMVEFDGGIVIVGNTSSPDFFCTPDCWDSQLNGGTDCFIRKYDFNGDLVYSSYFGGNGADFPMSCLNFQNNELIIQGRTLSDNIATENAIQQEKLVEDCLFLAKWNFGIGLSYCTYLNEIEVPISFQMTQLGDNDLLLVGTTTGLGIATSDAYQVESFDTRNLIIMKCTSFGEITYLTYWGQYGVSTNYLKLVGDGFYLCGVAYTNSALSTPGAYQEAVIGTSDMFLAKFSMSIEPQWCTYIGGNESLFDQMNALAIDNQNNVIGVGYTEAFDFPVSIDASQNENFSLSTNTAEMILTKWSPNGDLLYSSYFGAGGSDYLENCIYSDGKLYTVGSTSSTSGLFTSDLLDNTMAGVRDGYLAVWDVNVGLEEVVISDDISIYPNPFNDKLFFETRGSQEDVFYSVSNVLGQVVTSGRFNTRMNSFDTSSWISGAYMISFYSKNQMHSFRVVKE